MSVVRVACGSGWVVGVRSMYFSANGRMITAYADDKHVRSWEVESGKLTRDKALEFGGRLLAVTSENALTQKIEPRHSLGSIQLKVASI